MKPFAPIIIAAALLAALPFASSAEGHGIKFPGPRTNSRCGSSCNYGEPNGPSLNGTVRPRLSPRPLSGCGSSCNYEEPNGPSLNGKAPRLLTVPNRPVIEETMR